MRNVLFITKVFDPHTDFLIKRLREKGIEPHRFNTEDFPDHVQATFKNNSLTFRLNEELLDLASIGSVVWRKPKPYSLPIKDQAQRIFAERETESFFAGMWLALEQAKWINHPLVVERANKKLYQLMIAQRCGLNVPETVITNNPLDARNFCNETRALYKTLTTPVIRSEENPQAVYATEIKEPAKFDFSAVQVAPCQFQGVKTKVADIKIVVIGDQLFPFRITGASKADIKSEKHEDLRFALCQLPQGLVAQCWDVIRFFQLEFCTFDLVEDMNGTYWFMEINPKGQWYFLELETGIPLVETFCTFILRYL